MQARDASGRKVSLLNDDAAARYGYSMLQRPPYANANHMLSQSYHGAIGRSASSSPNTPELHRSDSYDSQASADPISPMTPNPIYTDYATTPMYAEGHSPYDDYLADAPATVGSKRLGSFGDSRSVSYDEGAASPSGAAPSDRPGKRYPCRYRDSHGCEKTFTTSGHASRHSKIHTAEKAVQCTFSGCSKKFTRADNMKQHLETHFKDKSRASVSRPSLTGRRSSSSGKSSSGSSSSSRRTTADSMPLPSPGAGAWDMRGLDLPLMSRPSAARTPSSGLDALAMAVACQEGRA